MRWPKFKKFWTKIEEELPVDESEKQEEQSKDEIDLGDIHFGEEVDPEAKAKTFVRRALDIDPDHRNAKRALRILNE